MTDQSNRFLKFWNELKRRKVVKVTIIYASTAFILLQLISILIEPLHLPQWVMTFFVIFLLVGFPIVVILSWIFDITPQGIEVTQPVSEIENKVQTATVSKKKTYLTNGFIGVLLIVVAILVYPKIFKSGGTGFLNSDLEKSIAILPFTNDSNDSTNVYIINGLMESILNNLAKVKDLKVISRTSVENYRNNNKLIPDIAKELNVSYIVEGSGQKIGDKIMLTVQLLEAENDKHLWSEQYNKDAKDIFKLQIEVAKTIADKIQAIITPEEAERINKAPTDNLIAYDYFLKGHELYWKYFLWFQSDNKINDVEEAITYFEKALELDNEFALAYAELSISLGTLFGITKEESHSNQARINADKALLYDPQLEMGLIAKALTSYREGNYELEAEYLKKAVRVNPNSYVALARLALFYGNYLSDTELFLEYFLKAFRLNAEASERVSKSSEFSILSRAFREAGFLSEADYYLTKSLLEDPDNINAILQKAVALIDKDGNYQQSKEFLFERFKKDTTNIQIIRRLAYTCYFMRDYTEAAKHYKKMIDFQEVKNYSVSPIDSGRIGIVLSNLGKEKESEEYFRRYRDYAEKNNRIDKYIDLAAVYALEGDSENALEQMRIFSEQNNYPYWMILYFKDEPLFDNIRDLPEFKKILANGETKFWKNHERIKASLKEKGLL